MPRGPALAEFECEDKMRFIVAIAVAGVIIAGGAWFVRHTERWLREQVRTAIREGRIGRELPADFDAEETASADFGTEMPAFATL